MVKKCLAEILLGATLLVTTACNNRETPQKSEKDKIQTESAYFKKQVDSLNDLAWNLIYSDPNKSIALLDSAQNKSKQINYELGLRNAQFERGALHYLQGEYDLAKKDYKRYLNFVTQKKDSLGIAKSFNNLAVVSKEQGKYNEAVNYYINALKIYEKLNAQISIAKTYNNLGLVFSEQGNNQKAYECFQKDSIIISDFLKKDTNNIQLKNQFSNVLLNLGTIFDNENKYEKSLKYYFKSLKFANETNNKYWQSTCFNNIASIYEKQGNSDNSLNYYNKSLKLNKELKDKESMSVTLMSLAEIYKKRGNYSKSLENLIEALDIAKDLGRVESLKSVYESLYEVYKEKGDFSSALKYHESFLKMNDSIFNINSSKQINELNTKYETDKKEKENEVLRKDKELKETKLTKQRWGLFGLGGILGLSGLLAFSLYRSNKDKKKRNELLSRQKKIIEEKNQDIMDSIVYARNIQKAILPEDEEIKKTLEDCFVFYKPKDIVSGDFYWIAQKNEKTFFSACDCTGHGVPGAFMSVLSSSLLNESVNIKNILEPSKIFNNVRKQIISSLKAKGEFSEQKDGFDGVLCAWDKKHNTLEFACANNPLYLIRNNEFIEYKADKMPVGYSPKSDSFKNHKIELQKGDLIYIFSDGYQDQFGGENGKKFMTKNLKGLLLEIHKKSMQEQKEILNNKIVNWMGKDYSQIDDILLMGVKF